MSGRPGKKVSVTSCGDSSRVARELQVPEIFGAGGSTSVPPSSSSHDTGQEIKNKVETKLMSLWANMKYGWTVKLKSVNFTKDHPIFLLGKFYHKKDTPVPGSPTAAIPKVDSFEFGQECAEGDEEAERKVETEEEDDGIEGFKKDFWTRLWFTYRREFQSMNGTNFTTDCGWGCMLRSGQMLLAQGLLVHFLGRSWRYTEDPQGLYQHQPQEVMHRKIISWFGDNPSHSSPFSIHQLVRMGEDTGRRAGDWYGPNAVANLIRKSHLTASKEIADLDTFSIYVAQNCTIFIQDVLDQCLINEGTEQLPPWQQPTGPISGERRTWKSLILLVPLRLGGIHFNPIYGQSLKGLLTLESCLGIIGGRPKHSLYFMGFQEDKLIFLDPHYCQENVDVYEENFRWVKE